MVARKCKLYAESGIQALFVLDPEDKLAWSWNRGVEGFASVSRCELPNGATIDMSEIWRELDARR